MQDCDEANHRPVVEALGALDREADRGDRARLVAEASDPDGDEVTFRWVQ